MQFNGASVSRVGTLGRRVARGGVRRLRAQARTGKAMVVSLTDRIRAENMRAGSRAWQRRAGRLADDKGMQVKGYASLSAVDAGASLDFHVTVTDGSDFTISIYRLGDYAGTGGRLLLTSPTLPGVAQPAPNVDDVTGTITCDWSRSWRLKIPRRWTSGLYLAIFTTTTGWRSYTPFVVRDGRKADLCVLLPFSTYQAYNQWPFDGRRGKSLYYGYDVSRLSAAELADPAIDAPIDHEYRTRAASFDRPYAREGLPNRFVFDQDFVQWVERAGFDVTYADSMDLHTGKIDPSRYRGLIFCGHDEYWSTAMRDAATKAVEDGTSLAFMTANNAYWHVRINPSADGRENRTVVCYKGDVDPEAGEAGGTSRWREPRPAPARPEHELLGVQYNGVVATPAPLVVQAADHWFWANCGVQDGDHIGVLVKGEADGFDPDCRGPENVQQTLLSSSPYLLKSGIELIQNTSVYETPRGAVVFDASTLDWPAALNRNGQQDVRIQTATANLLRRMTRSR